MHFRIICQAFAWEFSFVAQNNQIFALRFFETNPLVKELFWQPPVYVSPIRLIWNEPTYNHGRRRTTLLCLLGSSSNQIVPTFSCEILALLTTNSDSPRCQRQHVSHVMTFLQTRTAIGLPMPRHWDFETRCSLMKTMLSAVLFLASNRTHDFWCYLGNAIGHPMPGLDYHGLGRQTAEPHATRLR